MKKKLFFMPFLAAALFSCSEKGLVTGGDDVTDGESEISYLSVNIVSSQEAGTRAAEEDFKVGSAEENKVNSIRFYFFAKDGKAAAVKGNGVTYYDVTADEISNDYTGDNADKGQNIESTVSAVIVIESPKNDGKPYYVAAVVNPTADAPVLKNGEDDVTKLQEAVKDFSTTNGFVMSSSVYKDKKVSYSSEDKIVTNQSEDMEYIMVPVFENIQPTRLEAEKKPATLYVERVLAKVSVSVNITESSVKDVDIIKTDTYSLYPVGKIDKGAASGDGMDIIYAQFLGWNVTATRNTSRLVKKIDINWAKESDFIFAGWNNLSWNDDTHYRSYWAINPNDDSSENPINDYYNFGDFDEAHALPFETSSNKYNYTYLQENAGKYENGGTDEDIMTSKIIVAAQLVDKNGSSLELVEWGGDVYVKSDQLMDALASATQVYTVTESGGAKQYTSLKGKDIKLVHKTVTNADEASKADSPRYYVSIELKDQSTDTKYAVYTYKNSSYSYEEIAGEDLKKALASVGKIKYWKEGSTYYWVDIKHFGGDVKNPSEEPDEPLTVHGTGKLGVVRNHWYDYTFTSVKGLGVPVPDPNETIYPETPNDPNLFYLAAEIKILSWRMVQHNNEGLGWD